MFHYICSRPAVICSVDGIVAAAVAAFIAYVVAAAIVAAFAAATDAAIAKAHAAAVAAVTSVAVLLLLLPSFTVAATVVGCASGTGGVGRVGAVVVLVRTDVFW